MSTYKRWCIQLCAVLGFLPMVGLAQMEPTEKGYLVDRAPAWVTEQSYDANKTSSASQGTQYLLVDQQQHVLQDQKLVPPQYHYHFVIRILNSAGLSQSSQLHITFNPAYQTLHLHSLKIIRNGETRDVADQVYVRMVQQEQQLASDIHDGLLTAVLIPEDIRVGDIIDYSYTIEGRNPIFGTHHFGNYSLNWAVPVDKMAMRVVTDSSRFSFRSVGIELKPTMARFGGLNEYKLVRMDVPAVIDDGETSLEYTRYAWMDFSEYPSWQAVNRWAAHLYDGVSTTNDDVKALARKLRQQATSEQDYITRALFFVQNEIRYVGLELGVNSHRPRAPGEVLQKRYGDCKDKSLLLTTLLQLQGIDAWPALVSSVARYSVMRNLPSPGVFDHVVTLVEFNGKRYWLDGTRLYQAGRLDNLGIADFGYALVVGHRNQELQRMYETLPIASLVEVEEDILADAFNQPVTLKIKSVYHGNAAEMRRYQFQTVPLDNIKRNYLEYFSRYYKNMSAESALTYEDDTERNRFVVYETYRIDDYWKRGNALVQNKIFNLSYIEALKAPTVRQRQSPYYLGLPRRVNSVLRLHYPESVTINLDETPVSIENPAFKYTYQDRYADGVYTHRSSLNVLQKDVAVNDMDSFLRALDQIHNDWEYTLTVGVAASVPGRQELQTLKARLKKLAGKNHD